MAVVLSTWNTRQSFAVLVEIAIRVELASISAKDLRVMVHLPDVRKDDCSFRDEVAFIVVVLSVSMRSISFMQTLAASNVSYASVYSQPDGGNRPPAPYLLYHGRYVW